jgi:hypothetical protein
MASFITSSLEIILVGGGSSRPHRINTHSLPFHLIWVELVYEWAIGSAGGIYITDRSLMVLLLTSDPLWLYLWLNRWAEMNYWMVLRSTSADQLVIYGFLANLFAGWRRIHFGALSLLVYLWVGCSCFKVHHWILAIFWLLNARLHTSRVAWLKSSWQWGLLHSVWIVWDNPDRLPFLAP